MNAAQHNQTSFNLEGFAHLAAVNNLEIPSSGSALMQRMLSKSITAEAILEDPYLVKSREADLSREM